MSRYKQEAYEQAVQFRRRGFTYSEIAKICDVSKATVSNWLRHEPFSQEITADNKKRATADNTKRLALINKARVTERKRQYTEVERMAAIEYRNYRASPVFMAGITLYMAAGAAQSESVIRLTTSNLDQQKIFMNFAIRYLGVEKSTIRVWLLLYPDLDEVRCMKKWCRTLGISPAQFYKSQVVVGRSNKRTLHFGVLNTIIGSTLLKRKLETWLMLAKRDLTTS